MYDNYATVYVHRGIIESVFLFGSDERSKAIEKAKEIARKSFNFDYDGLKVLGLGGDAKEGGDFIIQEETIMEEVKDESTS